MKTEKSTTHPLPCALCGREQHCRTDKNGKPYFVCLDCQTQYFVRGQAGIERLQATLSNAGVREKRIENELGMIEDAAELCECELRLGAADSEEPIEEFLTWTLRRTASIRKALNLKRNK